MLHSTPNTLTDIYNGLSNEQIAEAFPAVFAEEPHDSRSSRYMFLPTHKILTSLRQEGFVPTQVVRQKSRVEGQQSHGKHFLRLRHVNDLHTNLPEVHEIGVLNSHNGASGLRAMAGLIRFVCENGCIFGDINSSLSVQHRGNQDMLDAILKAVFQIAANSVQVMETVEYYKQIMLSWEEQLLLSEAAMTVRFNDKVTVVESDDGPVVDRSLVQFQPQDFLRAARPGDFVVGGHSRFDAGDRDLHTTYQVLQENLVERPIRSSARNPQTHRRSSTRALNGIEGNVQVNTALWQLTQRMAEIKG
jgi:hypothetical protein